ncbi:MAG: hypothetical protein K2N63_14065, partial [Lachnospiraceae bacterium]|nr:hypothetical protein [Lachnospiraceae bacterium]
PSHTHGSGNLSTAGFEKARYYSRQSWWSEKPVIHICTGRKNADLGEWKMVGDYWNYVPGEEVEVRCYTNCAAPILQINNVAVKTQGEYVEELGFYRWFVPFEPGTITASVSPVLEDASVKPHADSPISRTTLSHTLETVGAPVQLGMEVVSEEDIIQIEISVLDANGRRVAADQSRIDVHIEGKYEYLGLDNGDIRDVTDYRASLRNALEGRLMLYLRKTTDAPVTIIASNPYLHPCRLSI